MPIYEFECSVHGRFERIFSLSMFDEIKDGTLCGKLLELAPSGNKEDNIYCGKLAQKVWSQVAFPSHGFPTTVFRNPITGDTRVAILRNQETPKGYERIDLKTPFERTKMEKEMQKRADAENDYITERNRFISEETRKRRQDNLKANMSSIVSKADNPSAAESLLKAAMNRNKKKKLPKKDTAFHFAVNHTDKSNLNKG